MAVMVSNAFDVLAGQLYPTDGKFSRLKQAVAETAGPSSGAVGHFSPLMPSGGSSSSSPLSSPIFDVVAHGVPMVTPIVGAVKDGFEALQGAHEQWNEAERSIASKSRLKKELAAEAALATPVAVSSIAGAVEPFAQGVVVSSMTAAAPFAVGGLQAGLAVKDHFDQKRAKKKSHPAYLSQDRLKKSVLLAVNPDMAEDHDRARLLNQAEAMSALLDQPDPRLAQHQQELGMQPMPMQTKADLAEWMLDKQELKLMNAKASKRDHLLGAAGSVLAGCAAVSASIAPLSICFAVASGACYAALAFFKGLDFWKNKQAKSVQQEVFRARVLQMADRNPAFAAQLQALHDLNQRHTCVKNDDALGWWDKRSQKKALKKQIVTLQKEINQAVCEDIARERLHLKPNEPVPAFESTNGLQMMVEQYCAAHQKEAKSYLEKRQQRIAQQNQQAQIVTPFALHQTQPKVASRVQSMAAPAA